MTTYFTVFAGRRRFLSVLMAYVRPLLEQRVIDRVHLWDYCRLPSDREFLKERLSTLRGVEVVTPPASDRTAKFPNKWKGYYAHYASLMRPGDLLVKCDDDIVFISNLHVLLDVARRDAEGAHHLYYPSVVNNDVAAAFQAADGVITDPDYLVGMRAAREEGRFSRSPMSDWFNCTDCAEHVHAKFLARPEAFFTGCLHEWRVPCRVPINLFVMRGAAVREHFGAFTSEQFVDEAYLTALLTERTKVPSLIVSDSVVVHFSFGFQHMANERALLEQYRELSRNQAMHMKLKTAFGSRTLSRSCPDAALATAMPARRQPPYSNITVRGGGRWRGARAAGAGVAGVTGAGDSAPRRAQDSLRVRRAMLDAVR